MISFDCNVCYGCDVSTHMMYPIKTVDKLESKMKNAGMAKAMVNHIEIYVDGTSISNQILAEDIAKYDNLDGKWGLLPSQKREIPEGELMLKAMKKNRIYGCRLILETSRYFVKDFVLKDLFELAIERNIPIFINTVHGTTLKQVAELLKTFPKLMYVHICLSDRFLSTFIVEYPNVYVDLTYCITDEVMEFFVKIWC